MDTNRQRQFLEIADEYKNVICKVCSVYSSDSAPFEDLYQEVMISLWTGLETYRGDSKMSTWIYRVAINTCISWTRRNRKHSFHLPIECGLEIHEVEADRSAEIGMLYALIAKLTPFDKALISLWLDDKSYDDISAILGISKSNVATKLHRIRMQLSKFMSNV